MHKDAYRIILLSKSPVTKESLESYYRNKLKGQTLLSDSDLYKDFGMSRSSTMALDLILINQPEIGPKLRKIQYYDRLMLCRNFIWFMPEECLAYLTVLELSNLTAQRFISYQTLESLVDKPKILKSFYRLLGNRAYRVSEEIFQFAIELTRKSGSRMGHIKWGNSYLPASELETMHNSLAFEIIALLRYSLGEEIIIKTIKSWKRESFDGNIADFTRLCLNYEELNHYSISWALEMVEL